MAIRREAFEAVGGYDPEYFIYMSDFDLGRRLQQAGYRQRILGDCVVPHDDLSPISRRYIRASARKARSACRRSDSSRLLRSFFR